MPPVPIDRRFTTNDYPVASLRNNEQGRVLFRLEVDATGKATTCAVTRKVSPSLDRQTCDILMKRFSYRPATDAVGQPVAGQ